MLDSLDINMDIDLEPSEFHELSEFEESDRNVNTSLKQNSTNDYNDARASIKDLIQVGSEVIPDLAALAANSESANVYKVLSDSLKTLSEMNVTLLELTKQQQEIVVTDKSPDNITNNNNLYVQSTEDLLRMIKNGNKPNEPE